MRFVSFFNIDVVGPVQSRVTVIINRVVKTRNCNMQLKTFRNESELAAVFILTLAGQN
jgi:hypothetical protein